MRKIVVPATWKTASNEAVKLEPAVADQEPEVLESLVETQRQVAGLLDRPLPGRVGGDAAQVHPAGAVLDEHQHVQPLSAATVSTCEKSTAGDPGGLGVQELPPTSGLSGRGAGSMPAARRIS